MPFFVLEGGPSKGPQSSSFVAARTCSTSVSSRPRMSRQNRSKLLDIPLAVAMPVHVAGKERRGGAPRKAEGGLNKVLFVRADEKLLAALDALAAEQREAHEGRTVSRADVARELLHRALKDTKKKAGEK